MVTRWILFFVTLFFVGVVLMVSSLPARASESCQHHECDAPPVVNNIYQKDVIPVDRIVLGVVIVGTAVYCAIQRWGYNNPCISSEPVKKITAKDDKVTPDNLSDRPIGVRLYQ